jgi:WD40 repeat protein
MTASDHPCERDDRVNEAIADYLEAAEAGQAPDRREFLARHPDLAADLTAFFTYRDRFTRAAGQIGPAAVPRSSDATLAQGGSAAVAPPMAGRSFGDYELLEEIARGGMGVIFKARQVSAHRVVALKMVLGGALASPADVKRFHTEAEAAANLDHPHIIPLYDVGEHEGQPYFSMKLVEGGSLAQRLGEFVGDPRAAARLVAEVARAVHYAHQRGILHRDLKPANILLDEEGRPHVTDFGLAKRVAGDSGLTQSGAIVGTPGYMAPEQASGQRLLTTAADVYALGAILYELLTGRPPFRGEVPLETLMQVLHEEPTRPRLLDPRIDPDLETVCLKCLQKEPHKRYASAEALAQDLESWLAGEPIRARPSGTGERLVKWARRRPTVAALTAALALLLLTLAGGTTTAAFWFRKVAGEAQGERNRALEAEARTMDALTRAEKLAELDRLRLYAQRVNLAQRSWERGDLSATSEMLDSLRPGPGQSDIRGFEWYYLRQLCRGGRRTFRHDGPVRAAAFSPDGRTLATAGNDGQIRLWDLIGQDHRTLADHRDWVGALAFHPDGKLLASAGRDRLVKLWDVGTGKKLAVLSGHQGAARCLAFSPDGKRLASGAAELAHGYGNPYIRLAPGGSGEVILWDVEAHKEVARIPAHPGGTLSVAFSPDGRTLASSGRGDRSVKLWKVSSWEQRATFTGFRGPVFSMAFSPDGRSLAAGGGDPYHGGSGELKLCDLATAAVTASLAGHTGPVQSVAFSADGKTLATGGCDQAAVLWDIPDGRERHRFRGHTDRICAVALTPDGQTLASAGWDGTVQVWGATRGQQRQLLRTRQPGQDVGGYFAAFSPDSKLLATGGRAVRVYDPSTFHETRLLDGSTDADIVLAFSPDGSTLAAVGVAGVVRLWGVADWQQRELRGHQGKIWSLAFSPDGASLATGGDDGILRVWDLAAGRERFTAAVVPQKVRAVAFTPDGSALAAACKIMQKPDENRVRRWDVAAGKEMGPLGEVGTAVEWVAFSPDGRTFACCTDAGADPRGAADTGKTVELWDVATNTRREVLRGHIDKVYHGTFSPDGRTLATAGWDGAVKLWHVATGQEMLTFRVPGVCWCVAFAPDGRKLVMCSGAATTREVALLEAPPEEAGPAE